MRKFLVVLGILILIPVALLAFANLWLASFRVSDPQKASDIETRAVLAVRARDGQVSNPDNGMLPFMKAFYAIQGKSPQADLDQAIPFRAFQDYSPQALAAPVDFATLVKRPTPAFTTALEAYEANLPQLEKLLGAPMLRFESQWDKATEALVPNFILMRAIAQNLDGYIGYLVARGRLRDAHRWALLNFQFGPKLAENGTLITAMIAVAMHAISYPALANLVVSGKLSDSELEEVARVARESRFTPELWLARCDEEYALELNCVRHAMKGPGSKGSVMHSLASVLLPGLIDREMRILQHLYLQDRGSLETMAEFPAHHAAGRQAFLDKNHTYFAALLYPNFEKAHQQYRLTMDRDRALQILVALERYRRKHRSYPARLEELVPGQLAAVPKDILTGGEFEYARSGQSFTLRSVYQGLSKPDWLNFYPPKAF